MKFKYCFFLSIKSFFHKKINILNVFLLIMAMTMAVLVSSFSKTFSSLIDNQVNGNINHRALLVNSPENNKFDKIKNVAYTAEYNSYGHYVNSDKGEVLNLKGIPESYLKIIEGVNLSDSEEKRALICPSQFYLGKTPEEYNQAFLDNLKNGKSFLNQQISLESSGYKEIYKIVGIYDVNKYMYGEFNVCFTTQSNIKEIFDKEMEEEKKECDSETTDCESIGESTGSVVIVDDINKIDDTQKEIESKGYVVGRISNINLDGINAIQSIFIIISVIIMIITFMILLVSNNKFIQYNKKNNLIYKALGYSNNLLIKINYLESAILSIISFVISIIIVAIVYMILSDVFVVEIKTGCPIYISYIAIIMSFILTMIISSLSSYVSLKNNDNSIIGEFADEEL